MKNEQLTIEKIVEEKNRINTKERRKKEERKIENEGKFSLF
jgi:hypothetical protein